MLTLGEWGNVKYPINVANLTPPAPLKTPLLTQSVGLYPPLKRLFCYALSRSYALT